MFLKSICSWQPVDKVYWISFNLFLMTQVLFWAWYLDVSMPSRAIELDGSCLLLSLKFTNHFACVFGLGTQWSTWTSWDAESHLLLGSMALHGCAALLSVLPLSPPVIACFLWPLPVLVSDYLLPQRSDHLFSVFPLLIVILAKLSDKWSQIP